jgi:hypothetical protein
VQCVTERLNSRIKLHIFVVTVRRNVRQTDCMMLCVRLLGVKDEVNYFNCFVSILFTLKCHVIP